MGGKPVIEIIMSIFKKYYYIHLVENNIKKDADSFGEYFGVVKATSPIKAVEIAREKAEPKTQNYHVKEIKTL